MQINNIVSISEANQNFSKVAKLCKEQGKLYIFKNNKPSFVIMNVEDGEMEITDDEKFEIASRRILKRYHKAFEELAK